MKRPWLSLLASLLLAAIAAGSFGMACPEGDDKDPGKVLDLLYFFDADALGFRGRVVVAQPQLQSNTRILAWTAPGDDGGQGTAAAYDLRFVRRSQLPAGVTDGGAWLRANWRIGRQMSNESYPTKAGRLQQLLLPRLDSTDEIWFGMRVFDEIGQDSGVGNIIGPVQIRRLVILTRTRTQTAQLNFGRVVDQAGDYNMDGLKDFVVGSPAEGRALLVLGRGGAKLLKLNYRNPQKVYVHRVLDELVPDFVIKGAAADGFGAAVAGVGSINGDMGGDLAIGAPDYDWGSSVGDAGKVFLKLGGIVFSGSSVDSGELSLTAIGVEPGGHFGRAVSGGGDIDLDTRAELLVGAPGAGAGRAYLFRGASLVGGPVTASQAAVTIIGESLGDELGAVVASLGDVNGDGLADLAIGAPGYDWGNSVTDGGAVYIFFGGLDLLATKTINLGADPNAADVTIRGSANNRRFGRSIAPAGNLAQIAITDPTADFAVAGGETVYVYFGGAGKGNAVEFPAVSDHRRQIDVQAFAKFSIPGVGFGAAIAGPGDLNHDNVADLVVGAPGADACFVYHGPIAAGLLGSGFIEEIPMAGGVSFGAALAGTGDFNLDGYPDLIIGDPDAGLGYFTF